MTSDDSATMMLDEHICNVIVPQTALLSTRIIKKAFGL
jgi:hypothetical protein